MEEISFSVDAGIINRLGFELVSKSETAVSELIKNAYDADANTVNLTFSNASRSIGGKLVIEDDGLGMTKSQLVDGFMRLATTDKLHNPVSEKFHRPRAGKKGIGRFATQRLGEKLTIITQTKDGETALKLSINWNEYIADIEVTAVKNSLEIINKEKNQGTTLIIEGLRDLWRDADIKRVYRYVSELIQPNFLKISDEAIIQESRNEAFEVTFKDDAQEQPIADSKVMFLDKAILKISGYIDPGGYGYCTVDSEKFKLHDTLKISSHQEGSLFTPFISLKGSNVIFQVFYFIGGDRSEHYYQNVTKLELKAVVDSLKKNGGIKVYRNGFKVAPYGDSGNDWLGISKKSRIGDGVPFTNNNMIGFVQISDNEKIFFEEVAGREGIIEKDAFRELQIFIAASIEAGFRNFLAKFKNSDEFKNANKKSVEPVTQTTVQTTINEIQQASATLVADTTTAPAKAKAQIVINKALSTLVLQTNTLAGELEMLRVLAGVGLTIGEFIHEIKQFTPSFSGYINNLIKKDLGDDISDMLRQMQGVFSSFQSYTAYFDATISQNVVRELTTIDLKDAVRDFAKIVTADLERRSIVLQQDFVGWDLITNPMHISEWNTILQNLYSNSKKAIYRAKVPGKILIKCFKEKDSVFLSFYDNGDGIPEKYKERIFEAFFTTSTPVTNDGIVSDDVTGTGLGLHIIKQIIINRDGKIWVDDEAFDYKTCITIQLPLFVKD